MEASAFVMFLYSFLTFLTSFSLTPVCVCAFAFSSILSFLRCNDFVYVSNALFSDSKLS